MTDLPPADSREGSSAARSHPPVCDAARYKTGCMCDECRAFDASLAREEREQRIKEGLIHGQ